MINHMIYIMEIMLFFFSHVRLLDDESNRGSRCVKDADPVCVTMHWGTSCGVGLDVSDFATWVEITRKTCFPLWRKRSFSLIN